MVADRGEGELLLFTSEVYDLEQAARLSDASVVAGDFKNIKLELAKVVGPSSALRLYHSTNVGTCVHSLHPLKTPTL
jgi:hypothetical protein